jgi:hypothetical protein
MTRGLPAGRVDDVARFAVRDHDRRDRNQRRRDDRRRDHRRARRRIDREERRVGLVHRGEVGRVTQGHVDRGSALQRDAGAAGGLAEPLEGAARLFGDATGDDAAGAVERQRSREHHRAAEPAMFREPRAVT